MLSLGSGPCLCRALSRAVFSPLGLAWPAGWAAPAAQVLLRGRLWAWAAASVFLRQGLVLELAGLCPRLWAWTWTWAGRSRQGGLGSSCRVTSPLRWGPRGEGHPRAGFCCRRVFVCGFSVSVGFASFGFAPSVSRFRLLTGPWPSVLAFCWWFLVLLGCFASLQTVPWLCLFFLSF